MKVRRLFDKIIAYVIVAAFVLTQNIVYAGVLRNDTLRPASSVVNGIANTLGDELSSNKASSSGLSATVIEGTNYRSMVEILSTDASRRALEDRGIRGIDSPSQMIEKMLGQYTRSHHTTPDDVIIGINPDNTAALRDLWERNANRERGPPQVVAMGGGGGFLYVTLKALTRVLGKLVYGVEPATDNGGSTGDLQRQVYAKKGYIYGLGDHVNGVANALYQPAKLGVLDYRPDEKKDAGKSMRQIVIEQLKEQIRNPMFGTYEANLIDAPDFLIFVANLLNVADIVDREFVANKKDYPTFSLIGHSVRNLYMFVIYHKLGVFPDGGYDASQQSKENAEKNAKIAGYILERMFGLQIEDPASPHMLGVSLGEATSYLTYEDPIPENEIQRVGEKNLDIRGYILVNGANSPFGPEGSVTVFGQRFIDQIQHNSRPIRYGLVKKVTPKRLGGTELIGGKQVDRLTCDIISSVDVDISHLRPSEEFMESVNVPGLEAITLGAGSMFSSLACQLAYPGVVDALRARKDGLATAVRDGKVVMTETILTPTKNILVLNHVAMDETNEMDFLAHIKMFEDIMTESYNYGKPKNQQRRIEIGDVFSHIIVNNTIALELDEKLPVQWLGKIDRGDIDARYEPLRMQGKDVFVDEYGIKYHSPIFVAENDLEAKYFWVPEKDPNNSGVIKPKVDTVQDATRQYGIKTNAQGDDIIDIPGIKEAEKPRIIYRNRYIAYLLDTSEGREFASQRGLSFDNLMLLSYLDHDRRLYASRSERGRFRGPIYATDDSLQYLEQNGISRNNVHHTDSLLSMQQKIKKASGVLQFDRFAGLDAKKIADVFARILDPRITIIKGLLSGDMTEAEAAEKLVVMLRNDMSQKQAIGEMLYDLYAAGQAGVNLYDNVINYMLEMLVEDNQVLQRIKDIDLAIEGERLVPSPQQMDNLARFMQRRRKIMLDICSGDEAAYAVLDAVDSIYMAIKPSSKKVNDVYTEIYKKQDIRGNAQSHLTDEVVVNIARAFAKYLKDRTGKSNPAVAIGKDVRLSSPHIMKVLAESLTREGIRVINVGHPYCSSPMVAYAIMLYKDIDAGIMITASHLESAYNGLKFLLRNDRNPDAAINLPVADLEKIVDMARKGVGPAESYVEGRYEIRSVMPEYKALLVNVARRIAGKEKPLNGKRIAIDAGNGVGGFFTDVLRELGAEVEAIHVTPDGTYPAHLPNPDYAWCMADLSARVRQVKADIGVGFDSDGDRAGFVDDKGNRITGNKLIGFLSRNLIAQQPSGYITTNVRGTQAIADMINSISGRASDDFIVDHQSANVVISDVHRLGDGRIEDYIVSLKDTSGDTVTMFKVEGHTIWTEAGYVQIKQILDWLIEQNVNVISATETSGHIMWTDMDGLDDGMYTAATVLGLVASSGKPMSEHMGKLVSYDGPEDTLRLDATDSQEYMNNVMGMLQNIEQTVNRLSVYNYVIDSIDGKRFIFTDQQGNFVARVLFRPSMSQPFIGIDLEARSAEEVVIIARAFLDQMSENREMYPINISPLKETMEEYAAKTSAAGYGIQKQIAALKQIARNNTGSYWDAVSVIVKQADAKYVVDAMEEARGEIIPENASVVLVDKDTDPAVLSRLFAGHSENGTTSVIVYVIEDDIEGNLSATMDNIRKVRQAGFDFESQHMLVVLAGGEAKRSWPGVASDGMGNKGLMASVNGRPNLYQALAESMQIYDIDVKGVVVMPTDRLVGISTQLTEFGQKDIQLVGSSMKVTDPLLAFYGKIEVADDGTLLSMPSRSDVDANERIVRGRTHVPSNNLTVWYASSRGISELLARLDPSDKDLNTIQDIFKKPSTFGVSIGYVEAGKDTLFAEIGDNTHLYETLQQLFESEDLRNLLGISINESGAIIADTVRLGDGVVVEPGAVLLGYTSINLGKIRRGAVVVDSIINEAYIASNSMVIAAEEPNILSTEPQGLVSDVRIEDNGLPKVIRVNTQISANPKDVWSQQIWQGYSYEQLKDLLDRDATAMFLARTKSSSAGIAIDGLSDYDAETLLADTLLNYAYTGTPAGITEINNESQAIIVYSDSLEQSPALQAIIRQSAGDSRKFYLVNKDEGKSADALLQSLNIDRAVFERYVFNQNSLSADQLALSIAGFLQTNNIRQGRVFAGTEADISAWSKQDLIEALVMLLKDKRFEIISNYTEQHMEYIRSYEQVLIAA
jgi:phosphomannomutase